MLSDSTGNWQNYMSVSSLPTRAQKAAEMKRASALWEVATKAPVPGTGFQAKKRRLSLGLYPAESWAPGCWLFPS